MVIIVGLGNPGPKYEHNRHNIGFMAVDAIHRRHDFGPWRKRFQGELAEGEIAGVRVILLKPTTFMNESGRSVGEVLRFYKAEPTDVAVFHDELDLEPSKLRVKLGGGAAGHNGLKSMIAHVGPHFARIRLGIGHPGHRDLVHHYVLGDFAKTDNVWLDPLLQAIAEHVSLLATDQQASFQNRVHVTLHPPKPKPPRTSDSAPASKKD